MFAEALPHIAVALEDLFFRLILLKLYQHRSEILVILALVIHRKLKLNIPQLCAINTSQDMPKFGENLDIIYIYIYVYN